MNLPKHLQGCVAMGRRFPNFTFPMVAFGRRKTPWNLAFLLYRGGAETNVRQFEEMVLRGKLDQPIAGRLPLVEKIHEEMTADLVGGGSPVTTENRLVALRIFFSWVDKTGADMHLNSAGELYVRWVAYLDYRQRFEGSVTGESAHTWASNVSSILSRVLGRTLPLLRETSLRRPRRSSRFHKAPSDKMSLTAVFRFGQTIVDLCEQLTTSRIKGPLPVILDLRSGQLEHWSKLSHRANVQSGAPVRATSSAVASANRKPSAWESDTSLRARYPLVNLRIEAELLMFIAQTSMNLQQAFLLTVDDYRYVSHLDGYQVKSFKARRDGSVLFEIFSEYRAYFECYLEWRKEWFNASEDRLFPLVTAGRAAWQPPDFSQMKTVLTRLGVSFIGPRALRKARVNWLLRESASSPEAVAEMAQHDIETLMRRYAEPHPQVAMVEISKFHEGNALSFLPPAPGDCVDPTPMLEEAPSEAVPTPDCTSSAGCLFCTNHRDIDSGDHVWSLASFRHLKSIELSRWRPAMGSTHELSAQPAFAVVRRVTQKLRFFETSSEIRKLWVREALARIEEGDYHPAWDGIIQLHELGVAD